MASPRRDGSDGIGGTGIVRCAVYTRKSTDEGLEQEFNSLDAQYEACAAYVASQRHEGWQLVRERYDDGGFSGGTLERPGLKRLLDDVAAGRIQVIVLYKIDRLTRSLADFAKIVDVLDKAGSSFVSVTQSFNTTTSMGRLTLNMLLSFAQFEREVTAERIRDKVAASKAKGIWMGGVVPLGYRVDNRKLVVDEVEAETVRHIFRRYGELPILKKGSLAGSSPIFSEADFAQLAKREACRFLAIKGERSELSEKLQAYIAVGEQKGFHLRYKCRHRKRWYEVPVVKVEDGFFFKRSHSIPRVIINAARVHVTDTAYGVRMKEGYSIRGLCFSFYTSLTMLFAELDGRFYGGGVLELSPKEFRGLPIVYYEPSDAEWEAFLGSHDAAAGDPNKILDFGDQRLRDRGSFTARQLKVLRRAWKIVRAHRMRHGGRSTAI